MGGLSDFYQVLGLDGRATDHEIARAYRSLIRRHHPDARPASASPSAAALERERLEQIMEAYEVLSDPKRRTRYDRARRPDAAPSAHVPVHYRAPDRKPQPDNPLTISPLRWEPPTRRCI